MPSVNSGAYNFVFAHSGIDATTSDTFHMTAPNYTHQGYRLGQTVLNYYGLFGGSYTGAGPSIASATYAGSTITAAIAMNGAASLTDTNADACASLTGLAISDGNSRTISSTSCSGSALTITASGILAAPVTVSYLQGENPAITNIVYSSNKPGADATAMPLLPTDGALPATLGGCALPLLGVGC